MGYQEHGHRGMCSMKMRIIYNNNSKYDRLSLSIGYEMFNHLGDFKAKIGPGTF
jgi:hypothetical protein